MLVLKTVSARGAGEREKLGSRVCSINVRARQYGTARVGEMLSPERTSRPETGKIADFYLK